MTPSEFIDPLTGSPLSQWRRCPVTERWVAIAPQRWQRPADYRRQVIPADVAACPFCEGHEAITTPEVFALRSFTTTPNQPGWRVRVLPNKYPAASPALDGPLNDDELLSHRPGLGVHEVIVETPQHQIRSAALGVEQFADLLSVYRQRLIDVRQDRRLRYGLIFKNFGFEAGASLEHLHSQLLATPMIPATVAQELHHSARYHRRTGRCLFCDLVAAERTAGTRIVAQNEAWIAYCPFASQSAWEVWIVPCHHSSDFTSMSDAALASLAPMMRDMLARLEAVLPIVAYNYWLHTSPFDTLALEHYHWHLEIMPRVTGIAGFEWGTGFAINPVSPESAARQLRQIS